MAGTQIVWNDTVIGTMPDPKVDNFFLYGRFVRQCSPETWQQLLDTLKEGDVSVELRDNGLTSKAWLITEPEEDDQIEVRRDLSR